MFAQPIGKPLDPRRDQYEWKALLAEAGVREARLHDARHDSAAPRRPGTGGDGCHGLVECRDGPEVRARDSFLGERYRRIARRRGATKANVAIGRSILVIVWHLLSDPDARFVDLGSDFHATRIDPDRRMRNHVRQLEALGYTVTLEPAA
jgi:hypothetical protein